MVVVSFWAHTWVFVHMQAEQTGWHGLTPRDDVFF
jgi:hypothetical protein